MFLKIRYSMWKFSSRAIKSFFKWKKGIDFIEPNRVNFACRVDLNYKLMTVTFNNSGNRRLETKCEFLTLLERVQF